MIDDERPDAPEEQPTTGGDDAAADAPDPSASADPSESPTTGGDPAPEEVAEDPADAPDPTQLVSGDEAAGNIGDAGTDTPTDASAGAGETTSADDAPEADAPADDAPADAPAADVPDADAPADDAPADDAPAADAPAADAPADDAPTADAPREERPRREKRRRDEGEPSDQPEVVPGAHLEPDLVLEADRPEGELDEDLARYAPAEDAEPAAEADAPDGDEAADGDGAVQPAARSALDLAADARYRATGKRKTAVARVILRPGDGGYSVNGRSLEDFFPRAALQKAARQPLEVAGFDRRMDVVARIHGGGVSAQAGALRHGVARALVEADPALRPELKRRGLLTRDARAKERKKAGLKKARKRPQFSKR